MIFKTLKCAFVLALLWSAASSPVRADAADKPRVIILSDIEADPDDTQSFVRLFLYSNMLDIEGIVATTSVWQKNRIAPESIVKLIEAYSKVHSNLLEHESGFPDLRLC